MGTQWKSARAFIAVVSLLIICTACQGNQPSAPSPITPNSAAPSVNEPLSAMAGQTSQALAAGPSTNGAAGQMPAYYDGQVVHRQHEGDARRCFRVANSEEREHQ